MTGVPQAIASIMTSPKGSGHRIGNSSARARPRNSDFFASEISPTYSTWRPSTWGLISCSQYGRSNALIRAANFSGNRARRAISIAVSIPLSGAIRPRKAR